MQKYMKTLLLIAALALTGCTNVISSNGDRCYIWNNGPADIEFKKGDCEIKIGG